MTRIELKIPIVPISWSGRGQTKTGRRFLLPRLRDYQAAIREHWQRTYPDHVPFSGPVCMDILFVFPRPKSRIWKKKPMPREPHISRPDRTNLIKAVEDALNGVAWRDDSQVFSGNARKHIAAGDEQPGIHIVITELDP